LRTTIDKILTHDDIDISQLSNEQKMNLISQHPSQKWSCKEEMANYHKECVDKYCSLYYDQYGFTKYNHPNFHVFDSEHLAFGYYYQNNFYLNVNDWKGSSKYGDETLTLHETVPGHHLQIDYLMHTPHSSSLAFLFQPPFNGFIEGWGLYSEHLGTSKDLWSHIGFLELTMLRTFRIIAEILLHVDGWCPEDVIYKAREYLTMSDKEINSEVYRYRTFPGQACSYKIGVEVIKTIVKTKFPDIDLACSDNLRNQQLIDFYKHLLWHHPLPLQDLLDTYSVTFTFDR
jgi:hypothetical protein